MKAEVPSDVVDTVFLHSDPGLVKSLGTHHTFSSALADLIDNSVDAGATKVMVNLLTDDDRLVRVDVLDNGMGMDATQIDAAMTLGSQRQYSSLDLGHFGVGMKAASLSQAEVLTVWSSSRGTVPVGRRIRRAQFARDFSCERLTVDAALAAEKQRAEITDSPQGTTVSLTSLRHQFKGLSASEARVWLSNLELEIRAHLGTIFHRLMQDRSLEIQLHVDDVNSRQGIGIPVAPVDPFAYPNAGLPSYPKVLIAETDDGPLRLSCHIWPHGLDVPGFRLLNQPGGKFQGFFVYRNGRLLQVGGWSDVANSSRRRQLARVAIEYDSVASQHLTMNPEKAGLHFQPSFKHILASARAADGTTFEAYLEQAEEAQARAVRQKRVKRKPAVSLGRGFSPALRRALARQLTLDLEPALNIEWSRLPPDQFMDVDFKAGTLWLNQRFRYLFVSGHGGLNDAPFIKALLYLLVHHVYEGAHLGSKDKDEIELWTSVLADAVIDEARRWERLNDTE